MYRIDVLFGGALEETLHYTDREEAEQVHQRIVSKLCREEPGKDWNVDLYDEAPYPPEPIIETWSGDVFPEVVR